MEDETSSAYIMLGEINALTVLVGKPEWKRSLARHGCSWEHSTILKFT
jgi:hypothetical protein